MISVTDFTEKSPELDFIYYSVETTAFIVQDLLKADSGRLVWPIPRPVWLVTINELSLER